MTAPSRLGVGSRIGYEIARLLPPGRHGLLHLPVPGRHARRSSRSRSASRQLRHGCRRLTAVSAGRVLPARHARRRRAAQRPAEPRDRHRGREERRHAQAARPALRCRSSATSSARSARCSSTGVLQAALLLLVAAFAFGVALPTEPAKWLTFAWVFLLGVTTSAILGIGLSALPRSGKSATAVIIPIVLDPAVHLGRLPARSRACPTWLQNVASIFPLKWMAQGMRSRVPARRLRGRSRWAAAGTSPASPSRCGIWLVVGLIVARRHLPLDPQG